MGIVQVTRQKGPKVLRPSNPLQDESPGAPHHTLQRSPCLALDPIAITEATVS